MQRSMRLVLLSFLALLSTAVAAPPELPPEARAAWEAMASVDALEAHFVQVRTSRLLGRPLESRGVLRFARPDRLAWIVESPSPSTFVLVGDRVGIAYPELGVRDEVDLSDNPDMARLVRGMMVWLSGDLAAVQRDYLASWTPGSPARAHLVPTDARLARLFRSIDLSIDGDPARVTAVDMLEPDGDTVHIELTDFRTGLEFEAGAFALPAVEP